MAETDRLELEIATKINKSGAEKVAALARAIRSLNNAVKQFDTTNFSAVVNQMSDSLKDFLATVKKSQTGLSALATILKKAPPKKATNKAKSAAELGKLGTETIDTGDTVDGTPAPKIKPVDNTLLNQNARGHRLLASAIKDENKEKEKSEKSGKKRSLKELAASIKRVAVYRAIRAVLKDVSSTMQIAFSYASLNLPEFNQSFSQIKSSLAVINGSVGVLATALLPIIQPLLTGIASVMATIANSVSKASAALRGQNDYLKVNADYWKDQKDQMNGSLLAFDTFTTLSQQTDMTGLFEKAEMTDDEMKSTANSTRTILTLVGTIGATLAAIKALKILDGVKDTLKNVKGIDSKTATIYATIAAIAFLVTNIIAVIRNPDLTGWQKFAALLTGALATAIAIMAVLKFTQLGWKGAIIAGAFAGGAMTWASSLVATKFADGGMFEGAGTMYAIAGESGAEVVAKGSQGTGVLNVEQFKTAMVQAFYEYGAARGDLSAASVTLNGEKVGKMTASSSYREMVRQGLL